MGSLPQMPHAQAPARPAPKPSEPKTRRAVPFKTDVSFSSMELRQRIEERIRPRPARPAAEWSNAFFAPEGFGHEPVEMGWRSAAIATGGLSIYARARRLAAGAG